MYVIIRKVDYPFSVVKYSHSKYKDKQHITLNCWRSYSVFFNRLFICKVGR